MERAGLSSRTESTETAPSTVDDAATDGVTQGCRAGEVFTLPCASRCAAEIPEPPRWFVALLQPLHSWRIVRCRLHLSGFAAFVPTVRVLRRHARRETEVEVPLFPRYVFVGFDTAAPGWQRVWNVVGVRRVFGPAPERPSPLPRSFVQRLREESELSGGPIAADLAPMLIASGATVHVTDGPFLGLGGVCLWSDSQRCRVMLSLLGRDVPTMLPRCAVVEG